jgi:V8-like Glu-specific endopeptidase
MTEARVPDANRPPFDAVGLLRMTFSDGRTYRGSGALVDATHVITCGHNITEKYPRRGFATAARFYPRWNSAAAPPPTAGIVVRNGFFASPYRDGQEMWDIGMMLLSAPAPAPLRYFEPQSTDSPVLNGQDVTLAGYPGNHNGEMWWDVDQVSGTVIAYNQLQFTHDTFVGSSGSPIYQYDTQADRLRLYAVHNAEEAGLRSGLLITPSVYRWLAAAVRQGPDPAHFAIGINPAAVEEVAAVAAD